MDVRRAVLAVLRAPKRFMDWVYTDTGRRRPSTSEVSAQVHSFGAGVATSREIQEAADARGQHVVAALDKRDDPEP